MRENGRKMETLGRDKRRVKEKRVFVEWEISEEQKMVLWERRKV